MPPAQGLDGVLSKAGTIAPATLMECVPKHGWSSSSSVPAATATPSTSVITTFSVILSPLGLVKSGACGFACPMALISLARMLTWRQRMRVGHSSDPLPGTRTLAWSVLATTHHVPDVEGGQFHHHIDCLLPTLFRVSGCPVFRQTPFTDTEILHVTHRGEPPKTGRRLAAG